MIICSLQKQTNFYLIGDLKCFLIIDLQNDIKGHINLGNDLSQAQDLLNMVENNLVFVKDGYNEFEKLTPKCSVEVVKEITLKKEGYGDKFDKIEGDHLFIFNEDKTKSVMNKIGTDVYEGLRIRVA